MHPTNSGEATCAKIDAAVRRFLLLLIASGLLYPVKECLGSEPSKRSRMAGWKIFSKAGNNAPDKRADQQQAESGPVPSPRVRSSASSFFTRKPKSPAVNERPESASSNVIHPVSARVVDDETAATVPGRVNDVHVNPQIPPSPDAARDTTLRADVELPLPATTLEFLTAQADAHHPRLTAAYQRVQAAQGRALQAGLYPNPKVAAASPQIAGNSSQYNGFVSQEIVTAGKLKISTAAAQQEVSQARFAWQQERFFVLTDLRQKYFATLASQRRVAILKPLVQIARRSRDISQKLLLAGEGARGDVLLLEIELKRAEVASKNASTMYEIGKRQLAILVAMPDLMIESLVDNLDLKPREYDLKEVQLAVASINPQATIARLEIDRNAILLQRARVEPIPNFDLMGGYQRQIGIPAQDQGLFQATMSIPIWNRNQGNISAAQAELVRAQADLHRVELTLANLAADALTAFRTAEQLVEQYESEILPKARETLDLNQQLYANGQIDFLRLLQSQKTLLDAELAWIDARERQWIAAAAIAGLLQEEVFP